MIRWFTDPDGVQWGRPEAVANRLHGVSVDLVRTWARRGRVRFVRVDREVWVAWPDCVAQEKLTRTFRSGCND